MLRIDGALLRRAINLFASDPSCADDKVVSDMLNVLDEDVLDMLAAVSENKILSREAVGNSEFIRSKAVARGLSGTRAMRKWIDWTASSVKNGATGR